MLVGAVFPREGRIMTSRIFKISLIAGLATLALAGSVQAAPGGGGGRTEKPSTPAATVPEASMTPEQKALALKQQAEELYDKGYAEVDHAAEEIEQAVKLEAREEPNSTKQAQKLRESSTKHYRKAIEKFLKATELAPTYHEAWNMLGYSYRKTGQIGNAFKAYDACLKLQPDYEPAHEYLGEAYIVSGDMDKARAELEWLKSHKSDLAGRLELAIQNHANAKPGAPTGAGW
jgi:Flp pilus assembly protein TadD